MWPVYVTRLCGLSHGLKKRQRLMKKGVDTLLGIFVECVYRKQTAKRNSNKLKQTHTMKVQTSTIDNEYKLTTYDNGAQYIVYGSASWLVGCDSDKTGSALKSKYFTKPQVEANNLKGHEMLRKAQSMRDNASTNRGYNANHRAKVERLMVGRADALESKAYKLITSSN